MCDRVLMSSWSAESACIRWTRGVDLAAGGGTSALCARHSQHVHVVTDVHFFVSVHVCVLVCARVCVCVCVCVRARAPLLPRNLHFSAHCPKPRPFSNQTPPLSPRWWFIFAHFTHLFLYSIYLRDFKMLPADNRSICVNVSGDCICN